MRRYLSAAAVVGLWSIVGLQQASAQIGSYSPPQTNPHPVMSPYLNMNRGNAAINYFGVVRPQMDMARGLQSLEQNYQYSQGNTMTPLGATDAQDPNAFLITGHPVSFMNTSQYFPVGGARMTGMGSGIGTSGSMRTINNSPTPLGYPRR